MLHKTFESTFSESHAESDHLLNLQHKINSATAAAHQIHTGQRPLSFSVDNILAPGRFGNHQFSVSHLSSFDVDGKFSSFLGTVHSESMVENIRTLFRAPLFITNIGSIRGGF